ncbi:hypothetical protein TWF679_002173 [Orbilia oligospora]|uniref:C3H1-type domain-containing protein n=1 Tax=Orbilia oligospora TaxID=2813651 RepID=A0A8H8UU09_ORBOL|nr:hypothetical protein TWF679_002173 [Orbilia oligospora]
MQPAMFTPNHYSATQQQQQSLATTAQQQLMQQQQMRRTTRSSQRSPAVPPASTTVQSMPPQVVQGHSHQMQYQTIPATHLQANGPKHLSYSPSLYVASPDQQMLTGRPASVNPAYSTPEIQFQFPTFEDIEDSSLLTTTSSHPYQTQLQSHSPDHQLLQDLQGTVNPAYNPADLQFSFSQFEDPPMMAAAGGGGPPHPSNPFQGQLNSNSPDPMLGGDAFRYRVMQSNSNGGDPVGQRAISPLFTRQQQQQQQQQHQQQQHQQAVLNSGVGVGVGAPSKQNNGMYSQDAADWRAGANGLYALDQYLGVQGQFPSSTGGTPQSHASVSGPVRQMPINQQPVQNPGVRQQMISVGPSDDIVETMPPKPLAVDGAGDSDVKPKATKKKKQQQQSAVAVAASPKLVNGSTHMMMDMERLILFDVNMDEEVVYDPTGSVTLSYEPVAPMNAKSPNSTDSPDPAMALETNNNKKAKSKSKAKAVKVVPKDPIAQMKSRMLDALEDDDVPASKVLIICRDELKAIAEDDSDSNEKIVAWLKTVFDHGFDDLFRLMTNTSLFITRIRKWIVDAWKADKMSAIVLHGLQVYQKLALDEDHLERFKLRSVFSVFSKGTRDEKVKQACAHILSRAAKLTAKQEAEAKKAEAKAKAEASKPASTKPSTENVKTDDKVTTAKPTAVSKSADSEAILKDAAKIASLANEDNKTGKRKTELLEKDHPSKRVAPNPPSDKSKIQLPIAPDGSKASVAGGAAKAKSSTGGFFADIQKAAKPKPIPAAPQPGGFTSIFDLLKEREAANAAAKSTTVAEKPPPPAKKKKTVRWRPDEELNEIRVFKTELPEGEDGNDPMEVEGAMDAGLVKAKVRANLKEEAQALKDFMSKTKSQGYVDFDDDFEMDWDSLAPILIDHLAPQYIRGLCFKRMGDQRAESQEAKAQQERERNVLAVHYSMSHPAPPNPSELASATEVEQSSEAWDAPLLLPPPNWRRDGNYLFADPNQRKSMAREFMPQPAPPTAPPPTAPIDLTSIFANLGGGQSASAPAVQPVSTPQEPPKANQLASILAELQKLAPAPAPAPAPASAPAPAPAVQAPQPASTPTPVQNNPLQSNPLLAFLGLQSQTPQPQAPAQPQIDIAKALQQLVQQQQPQQQIQPQQQPQQPQQPQQQQQQAQTNPFGGIPFPFMLPQQAGQAPAFPFNMPFPPPLLPGQNPLEMMAMYQAMAAQAPQQPQTTPTPQFGQTVADTLPNFRNMAIQQTNDVKMNDDSDGYQPPEQTQTEKAYQDNSHNNNNNGNNGPKEGKGSWSKFGKKKKHAYQDQPPYKKHKGDSGHGGKRVCAFWQAGNCLKKDDCQYSHDGPPGQGGSEQADQIRQHLYGKDSGDGGRSHEKKHKKFKKRTGYVGGSGSAADTAAASASNDWNGEMEY